MAKKEDERKGLLKPEQEKKIDKVIKLKGIYEMVDGPALRMFDNQVIHRLKEYIPNEYHKDLYSVIDMLVDLIPESE